MKKKRNDTILYASLMILGGFALLMAGNYFPVLWLLGILLLPPITLAALQRYPTTHALMIGAGLGIMCFCGAPGIGIGLVLFALWYGGALILRVGTALTPDLFPQLLYGGSLLIGLVTAGVCIALREYYGVWDIRSIFTALENVMLGSLDQMEQMMKLVFTGEVLQQQITSLELMRQNISAFAYQWISLILCLLILLYLWTLKAGQFLCRRLQQPIRVLSLWMFTVPREITVAYILLFMASLFTYGTDYQYAMTVVVSVSGFLFVLVGIGWLDTKMQKLAGSARAFIKGLLLVLAVISENVSSGILYSLLMIPGIFISLSRQIIVRRTKDGEK